MEAVLVVWVVNALMKIFPDTAPTMPVATKLVLSAARNEWESGQIAVRSKRPVKQLSVRVTELRQTDRAGVISAQQVECAFVGFIPIEHNTPQTSQEALLCQAPCDVPDVLLEDASVTLAADRTQPIWVNVHVPEGTPAGTYQGQITVIADGDRLAVPIELTVFDFDVPRECHLEVTNWFSEGNIAKAHGVELWSEPFFELLAAYARNMAAHRENVFWVSPWLVKTTRRSDGALEFDYALFDRFVETFRSAGVDGRVEIRPVAHHGEGGWNSTEISLQDLNATDAATGKNVKLAPEEGLGPFLSALEKHLEERGWLKNAMIHISDEPAGHNVEAWRRAAQFVHRYAPRLKRIEAIETTDFGDDLDVWVPKLSHLRNWYPYFDGVRSPDKELWYYICVHPFGGHFMNRFLDYPLTHVRLLHWLNWRYDLTGYLHWGWNHWREDPFGPPAKDLPPGDTHVVYPGTKGPLNSIRWEVQRDSLEDYEYLWLLSDCYREAIERLGSAAHGFDPALRSGEFSRRLVRDFLSYETDPAVFAAVREQLAREIESALQEPLVLWETLPSEDMPLAPGPVVAEVHGITHPGAQVQVNDKEVSVRDDGSFYAQVGLSQNNRNIRLHVSHGDKRKELTRHFAWVKL